MKFDNNNNNNEESYYGLRINNTSDSEVYKLINKVRELEYEMGSLRIMIRFNFWTIVLLLITLIYIIFH